MTTYKAYKKYKHKYRQIGGDGCPKTKFLQKQYLVDGWVNEYNHKFFNESDQCAKHRIKSNCVTSSKCKAINGTINGDTCEPNETKCIGLY